jgi:hypothetical protein
MERPLMIDAAEEFLDNWGSYAAGVCRTAAQRETWPTLAPILRLGAMTEFLRGQAESGGASANADVLVDLRSIGVGIFGRSGFTDEAVGLEKVRELDQLFPEAMAAAIRGRNR